MYLDERKQYALDYPTEYIEVKEMGYENRLDLDKLLLNLELSDVTLTKSPSELEVGS